ncbi:MAG: thiamine pyrophosphate-binding protein [Ruminococcus sp.]|nr:thiamine pyrophosphate-binding protein [Ruminococcus sp.]
MIRVADYIMKRIADEGVKDLFYVPGGQCVYLCDALRRSEELNAVSCHHEQAAAMAALAYSEYTNNFGACLVTTGCAGTNTLTGVLHAWQDSIPMIIVSGQQSYARTIKASGLPLRQVGVQEADIEAIAAPLTKYVVTVPDAKSIAYHMDKAIHLARSGRKGPVWIDVPLDVQNSMVDENELERYTPAEEIISEVTAADYEYILDAVRNAKRPVIHAGYGVRSAHAEEELIKFVETSHIPVTFSRRTYDMLPTDHRYNYGIMNGSFGAHRYANFIVQNSDLLIVIGSRLSMDTFGGNAETFARNAKIIVVDIDKIEHQKDGAKIDKLIVADAKDFLIGLNNAFSGAEPFVADQNWIEKCDHWKELFDDHKDPLTANNLIDAKYAMRRVTQKMPAGSAVVTDAGFTGATSPACCVFKGGEGLIHSFAQGEMGFSVPGACGVAAVTDKPVIAFEGDGSFMMNLQELQTIRRNNYNIKIVLINNNGYSGVRHGQKAHFRGKSIGTDPGNGVDFPDYSAIANAFGIRYVSVHSIDELDKSIDTVFSEDVPFILEIFTDPEQFDLHNALVMYGKRKVGFRPIEDQSPFIDRDVFFNEMIIEPHETSYGKPI